MTKTNNLNTYNIVVGVFYETPEHKIAKTYGYNAKDRKVMYYFDDGKGTHVVGVDEFSKWRHRQDLEDFPNARDPLLPYVFDLLWDIKHQSQLKTALLNNHKDIGLIKEQMDKTGIYFDGTVFTQAPAEKLKTPNKVKKIKK